MVTGFDYAINVTEVRKSPVNLWFYLYLFEITRIVSANDLPRSAA